MNDRYSCKICKRPNPRILLEQGKEPDFSEYLFWTKKMVIEHIKKDHPEVVEAEE